MKLLVSLLLAFTWLIAGCDKDRNRERTGIEDHPTGDPNVSGLDASGPASGVRTNAPPAK